MALCSQNLSIGVYSVPGSGLVELENNRMVGLIGRHYDKFLSYKDERNCLFKLAFFFNEELEQNDKSIQNVSATHLMRSGELDIHSVPQEFGYATTKLEMSKIITVSSYKVGHLIKKPDKLDKSDFSLFFINNISLLFVLLVGYCLTKIFIYIYFKLKTKNKFKIFNLFLINLRNRFKLSKVSYIILFFNIFLFINLSLLSNSIKTDKVIVKTDKLIDSFEKLNKTPKILTFYEDQSQIFTQAPETSFLHQFYLKKLRRTNEIYLISSKTYTKIMDFYSTFLKNGLSSHIFFMGKIQILATMRLLTTYATNQFLWIRSTSFYEELNCYYLNPNLEKKKKEVLHFRINSAFENGLYQNQLFRINEDLKLSISKELKIFESLKEYINEYSSASSDVHLDNYRTIFICYFAILILILIIFIFHHILKFIKRRIVASYFFCIKNRLRKNRKKKPKVQNCIKRSKPIYTINMLI